MDIRGISRNWRFSLISSHTVDALLQEDVGEVVVYDNFVRGRMENLQQSRGMAPYLKFTI